MSFFRNRKDRLLIVLVSIGEIGGNTDGGVENEIHGVAVMSDRMYARKRKREQADEKMVERAWRKVFERVYSKEKLALENEKEKLADEQKNFEAKRDELMAKLRRPREAWRIAMV